jgi:hypothetical protein
MDPQAAARNPFLLMLSPEVVLAAVERSERLGALKRHQCRPLDRPIVPVIQTNADGDDADEAPSTDDADRS